ncbi:hypothetical protein WME99_23505 [Sorangium sp. So ce136]|uniref:hypothetical protein n=1 Tax=Sorangium sp. So ce136 TaxID=3133284 RepID=UPI003F08D9CD
MWIDFPADMQALLKTSRPNDLERSLIAAAITTHYYALHTSTTLRASGRYSEQEIEEDVLEQLHNFVTEFFGQYGIEVHTGSDPLCVRNYKKSAIPDEGA